MAGWMEVEDGYLIILLIVLVLRPCNRMTGIEQEDEGRGQDPKPCI